MKLKKILEYMDPLNYIVIWIDDADWKDEPAYTGVAMDCPYWLANKYKIQKSDGDYEGFSCRKDLGEELNHREGIVFSVERIEEENE